MNIGSYPEYLFLYGSLMRELGAMNALSAGSHLQFVREARIPGQLYDLGEYPGLVPGQGQVIGEVYKVSSPQVWSILDPYEDYFSENETDSLYLRRQVELIDGTGLVWTYIYNRSVGDSPRIDDGDWRRYWYDKRQGKAL